MPSRPADELVVPARTFRPEPLPSSLRLPVPRRAETAHVHVLDEDPELGEGLVGPQLATARERLRAPVVSMNRGVLRPTPEFARSMGLLILDGMFVRRVSSDGASGAELLGPGDLLRVSGHPGEDISPWFTTTLRVLSRARVAVLDEAFTAQLPSCPLVAQHLLDRAMVRSHALAVSMAVAHYPRVDRRVLALLWFMAQRWGHVTSRGVVLRLPLTHSVLADLIAARRPSVTLALQNLERAQELSRDGADWILLGRSPGDIFTEMQPEPAAS
jgi:CRP/FNR family cyclic AMP-dependent transcriptional regulator